MGDEVSSPRQGRLARARLILVPSIYETKSAQCPKRRPWNTRFASNPAASYNTRHERTHYS